MKPTAIEGMTRDLAKPDYWDENINGPCGSLPIRDGQQNGVHTMTSQWKPSANELAILNAGGVVELQVCGHMHPPVSIIATC